MATEHSAMPTRRTALGLLLTGVFAAAAGRGAVAQTGQALKVYKESTCGCCGIWARHMADAGFTMTTVDVPDIDRIKTQLGVPARLATCHTAEIGGYLVEGHVPAVVVKRLLAEAPQARGVAVPGMPVGSPGMEGGTPVEYHVFLFGPQGISAFARCRGDREV